MSTIIGLVSTFRLPLQIPIILLATVDTSFRKNGHKKQISPGMKKHQPFLIDAFKLFCFFKSF